MQTNASVSHVSIIVPVGSRHSDIAALHTEYKDAAASLGCPYEMIYVLDGPMPELREVLERIIGPREPVLIIQLARRFGEATALMAGFQNATGDAIVTLPAYPQIEAPEISKLVAELARADVAVGHRTPRAGTLFEVVRRKAFHGLLGRVTGSSFRDLGCGARALHRRVLQDIDLYGDQHRFLAVLAERLGFRVHEVDVRQSPLDRFRGTYGPRVYARGLLDIFTVFFLARFTKKPLRFFGMVGVVTFFVGAVLIAWLVVERLFLGQALANRPALLLASLLVVLGVQLVALGLLGELIIFTHAAKMKEYRIESVLQFSEGRAPHSLPGPERPEGCDVYQ